MKTAVEVFSSLAALQSYSDAIEAYVTQNHEVLCNVYSHIR